MQTIATGALAAKLIELHEKRLEEDRTKRAAEEKEAAEYRAAEIEQFKVVLKKALGLDIDPDDTQIVVDGIIFRLEFFPTVDSGFRPARAHQVKLSRHYGLSAHLPGDDCGVSVHSFDLLLSYLIQQGYFSQPATALVAAASVSKVDACHCCNTPVSEQRPAHLSEPGCPCCGTAVIRPSDNA